jgi:hypothetical protein
MNIRKISIKSISKFTRAHAVSPLSTNVILSVIDVRLYGTLPLPVMGYRRSISAYVRMVLYKPHDRHIRLRNNDLSTVRYTCATRHRIADAIDLPRK